MPTWRGSNSYVSRIARRAAYNFPMIPFWALFPAGRTVTAKARAFTGFVREVMDQTESDGSLWKNK